MRRKGAARKGDKKRERERETKRERGSGAICGVELRANRVAEWGNGGCEYEERESGDVWGKEKDEVCSRRAKRHTYSFCVGIFQWARLTRITFVKRCIANIFIAACCNVTVPHVVVVQDGCRSSSRKDGLSNTKYEIHF